MRRRYKRELYADRVAYIKKVMPHCCIGVDVIVGFPGETHEDFLETYRFIQELEVSYLHVFTYSERNNTLAQTMDGVVSIEERRKRNEMLRMLSEKKKRYFYQQFENTYRPVLFETEGKEGVMSGFTDNYIKIETTYDESQLNNIGEVLLESIDADGVMLASLSESLSL